MLNILMTAAIVTVLVMIAIKLIQIVVRKVTCKRYNQLVTGRAASAIKTAYGLDNPEIRIDRDTFVMGKVPDGEGRWKWIIVGLYHDLLWEAQNVE